MAKAEKPLSFVQQLTLGLAVAVAGGVVTYVVSRDTGNTAACAQAIQLALGEIPNPAIDPAKLKVMANAAADRAIKCIKEG